jgi:hypothetical protein
MRTYTSVNVSDYDLSRVQDSVAATLNDITLRPLLDGFLLTNITLTTGVDNQINHKLGRTLQMWSVVRKNANANVWEVASATSTILTLRTSANVTISLWVA